MIAVGFLNESNAATEDITKHFPSDLEPLTPEQVEKNIVIFHDESTFKPTMMRPGFGEKRDSMC